MNDKWVRSLLASCNWHSWCLYNLQLWCRIYILWLSSAHGVTTLAAVSLNRNGVIWMIRSFILRWTSSFSFELEDGCNVYRPNQRAEYSLQSLDLDSCWIQWGTFYKHWSQFSADMNISVSWKKKQHFLSSHSILLAGHNRNISIFWSEFQPMSLLYSKMFFTKLTVEVYGFFSKSLFRSCGINWNILTGMR